MTTRRPHSGPEVTAATIRLADLHASLAEPIMESMALLNEITERHPKAISFAAGRPHEGTWQMEDVQRYLRAFYGHLCTERGLSRQEATRTLFQYGPSKGILGDLIARNLATDEDIHVASEAIVTTVGCQEAVLLALRTLCVNERDAVLAVSPTYVGLAGAARLLDIPVLSVPPGENGVALEKLRDTVRAARQSGLRPRAFYVIPDFSNPLGATLPLEEREALLNMAAKEDFFLLEDNPYGLFTTEAARLPTLKSLDTGARVIYLGSFAKTALPGARIGYVVADQEVTDARGMPRGLLADELARVKSMVTVNTSPLAQAVVGGKLIEHGESLRAANEREIAVYARNMRLVLAGLSEHFPPGDDGLRVTWNSPTGGFFLVVTLPFQVDDALLEECASRYGVIWTPMHHFYANGEESRQIRLSVSLLDPPQIATGLERLAAFIHDHAAEA